MTETYLQMTAALVFVVLLILAAGYFMRKKQGKYGLMNVVGYQSMGPRKGVAALKIGGEVLILGITSQEMRLLRTFREEDLDLQNHDAFGDRLHNLIKIGKRKK